MQLTKCIAVAAFLLVLFGSSCRSPKNLTEKETAIEHAVTDREIQRVEKTTKLLTTPQTRANLTLTGDQINNLPVGAKYQAKDGNATGTVEKTDKGIKFTASCDSLNFLVEQLTKEVYRYKSDSTALVTKLKQQQTIEVNRLTRSQSFQIRGFWILSVIIIVFIFNKFNIWQKLLKILKKLL